MRYEQERLTSRQRGYTAIWDRLSRLYRSQHPLCCGCEAIGIVEPATLVDHIEPHGGDEAKFWDEGNWQSSCEWHHVTVKAALERLWYEGNIVVADLRLDSAAAVKQSRLTQRKPAVTGVDGWPRG